MSSIRIEEGKDFLKIYLIPVENHVQLINTLRTLEKIKEDIKSKKKKKLKVEFNLSQVEHLPSSIISEFVFFRRLLAPLEGEVILSEVSPNLKSFFDIIGVEKLIRVEYKGV